MNLLQKNKVKSLFFLITILLSFFPFLLEAEYKGRGNIEVFCGSVFKPAIEEIVPEFERRERINVNLHIGSSGTMLSQIEISKRGDIYIPGSPDFMIKAVRKGVVKEDDCKKIAWIVPAIAVPSNNPAGIKELSDLAKPNVRVLIANPQSVCLGVYAVELLRKKGIYEKVKPNIINYAESCAKTASLVAMNTVDAAIGWSVFGRWNSDKVKIIPLKKDEIPRIAFIPVAITKYGSKNELAQKFITFLESDFSKRIIGKWGFYLSFEDAKRDAPYASAGGEYKLGDY
ncbi:MAG: molybdate ABC transporter substrate-binding protein [Candidatus Schekmanbacteria bacterium]|nr:MAG: molybdate ABC transporter substrate-binding protein [Candidatus Schekmanbacteria bacterium]